MPHPFATPASVRLLVAAAVAAPSVHNTQPWRFRVRTAEAMEVRTDPSRRLKVIDPRGRAMHISCGAALFNLRLAIRVTGHRPVVCCFPDGERDPRLLASVRVAEAPPAPPGEADLHAMIPYRRTNRGAFVPRKIPREHLLKLVAAAQAEGVTLSLPGARSAARVLGLVASADAELAGDAAYRAELARWTSNGARTDGVPSYAFGPRPSGHGMPVRDFGLTGSHPARKVTDFTAEVQVAALITDGDGPRDWLRAGQALQRVLLTAARFGLSVSFLNQPLDIRDRYRERDLIWPLHRTQMLLRLGYGPPVPGTPRRPILEVLDRV